VYEGFKDDFMKTQNTFFQINTVKPIGIPAHTFKNHINEMKYINRRFYHDYAEISPSG